jgi:hypothetical protein
MFTFQRGNILGQVAASLKTRWIYCEKWAFLTETIESMNGQLLATCLVYQYIARNWSFASITDGVST